MDGVDDLGAIDPLEVDRGDPEVRVSELALYDDERDSFVGHLYCVGVPQLVWRESAPDASFGSRMMQLFARGRWFPPPASRRAVDHAQQRADRQLTADLEPWVELRLIPKSE